MDISFKQLKRGSIIEGMGKGGARGDFVVNPVVLPFPPPPLLATIKPLVALPLPPPPQSWPPPFIPSFPEMHAVPF